MSDVVESCCRIHNSVVRYRKKEYSGTTHIRIPECEASMQTDITRLEVGDRYDSLMKHWRENVDPVESREHNSLLRSALMEALWERRGEDMVESDGDNFYSD
jgi:hypothetical protein